MEYWGVITAAWALARRSRPMWVLGAISAAQAMVYSVIIVIMLVPMTVLPQLATSLSVVAQGSEVGVDPLGPTAGRILTQGTQWFLTYLPLIIAAIAAIFILWIVLGVLDVASQPGMIAVVTEEREGRQLGASDALRGGFGLWWRTAALLAISALPAMLLILAITVTTYFTYTVPMLQGQLPNPASAAASQLVFTPIQAFVSAVTVMLSVVVQVSLRFAVLDDLHWREALRRGWALIKNNVTEVAVVYLLATVLAALAAIAVAVAFAAVFGVLAAIVGGIAALAATTTGGIVAAIVTLGAVLAVVAGLAFQALLYAWMSAVWTILWRRLTGREVEPRTPAAPASVRPPGTPGPAASEAPGPPTVRR